MSAYHATRQLEDGHVGRVHVIMRMAWMKHTHTHTYLYIQSQSIPSHLVDDHRPGLARG